MGGLTRLCCSGRAPMGHLQAQPGCIMSPNNLVNHLAVIGQPSIGGEVSGNASVQCTSFSYLSSTRDQQVDTNNTGTSNNNTTPRLVRCYLALPLCQQSSSSRPQNVASALYRASVAAKTPAQALCKEGQTPAHHELTCSRVSTLGTVLRHTPS